MQLIPIALIVLLLAMASGRSLVKRSFGSLTVEQKALVMDAFSTGNIWPLLCLAVGVALFTWILPWRIYPPYLPGFLATFLFTLVLVSVGGAATSIVRLSRAGLPRSFIRSVALRAVLFYVGLLLLISTVIYAFSSSPKRRQHALQSPNHAIELMASRPAPALSTTKTFSPKLTAGCVGRSSSYSR
jgi:hypothetical protein